MSDVLCPIVVGRESEMARLRGRLERARGGEGGVVALVGEPGVGKSRLVRELRREARDAGMTVLTGRAIDYATAPFRPLREALLPTASAATTAAGEPTDPFAPILGRLWNDEPQDAGEGGTLALGEAVVRLLASVARPNGVLLVLEDLHWSDPETLDVVGYLADHLADVPVLCLAAIRSGEDSQGERWARALAAQRLVELVEPVRLGTGDVEAMAGACLGTDTVPPELVTFLETRSEGLPLVVEELLAGLVSDEALVPSDGGWRVVSRLVPRVPLTLSESVQRRLETVGPGGAEVVKAAAVLGRRFDWSLLPAITGSSIDEVTAALRRARDLQIVLVDNDREFRFRHALTRDAVLQDLLPPERARLAGAALDAVEGAHPGLEDEWCELAAGLAADAGLRDRAVELLVEAARRSIARGAVTSAGATIERARTLDAGTGALDLDELAAQTAALAGEIDRALELGRAAFAAAADDLSRRARLHLVFGRALLGAGRWDEAFDEASSAASLADQTDEPSLGASARAVAAQAAIAAGRIDEARELAERVAEDGEHHGAPAAACEALEVLGRIDRLTDVAAAERQFERALAVAEKHGLMLWRARALHELGTIDLFTSLRVDRLLEARTTAPPALLALVDLHLSSVHQARWESADAYEHALRCVDLSRRLGLVTLGMGLIHLASAAAMGRRPDEEIEAAVEEALDVAGDEIDVAAGVPGRARFTQALMRADFAAARAHLDEAIEILRKNPSATFPFRGMWALLRTLADDEGAAARAEARASAGAGIPIVQGTVMVAEAVAAGRAGRAGEAEALYENALAALGPETGGRGWGALLHLLVGADALARGWGDGTRWLRTALACFDDLGLTELASACRAELRTAGQPVPRQGRGDSDVPAHLKALGVTSREVDVLRLLGLRLSNREIAQRLSLSPRTVERHVANLLTKTGVADRHAAARLLDEAR